ncbi:MAG: transcriptional repressor [Candidatus Zixiibacteriota bacterium]|nr:MAG: transcriptional repressor [candidate division Zixibacteria bacterium]
MNFDMPQRNTKQRQVILEELRKVTSHPTATEIYELVRQKLPKISLGTVYRNLELLYRAGTIQKISNAGREARFDGNIERHHHVRCVKCGRIMDINGIAPDSADDLLPDLEGWEIVGQRTEYVGLCPDCQAKDSAK